MDARSNFKSGIAYDDLREWLALAERLGEVWAMLTRTDPKESIQFIEGSWDSPADPRLAPEWRAAGDMTHSVAIINACKPTHWRHKFPPSNAPSAEVARKARERFGWLLDGSPQT
jgi:hypothetical protein